MDDILSRGVCRAVNLFKALTEVGWQHDRISGSHHVFTRAGSSCLPVAVHGGKVRRDVAFYVLRRANLPEEALAHEEDDDDVPSVALAPATSPAVEAEPDVAPPRSAAVDHRWVEASDADREMYRVNQERAADKLRQEREAFGQLLREVQQEILDGDYAAVHERLSPVLASGAEDAMDRLIERIGYELIGDALFFFSTASGHLATKGGDTGFGSTEQQQLITAAFAACKRLLEGFREKRDEARALLGSLLSHAYTLYLSRLMGLAISQFFVEFGGADLSSLMSKVFRNGGRGSRIKAFPAKSVPLSPGDRVHIAGLQSKPALNGLEASVLGYNTTKERYEVLIDGALAPMFIKCPNLLLLEAAKSEEEHSEEEGDPEQRMTPHTSPFIGRHSNELDRINASLRSGFNFIMALSQAERQLVVLTTQEIGPMDQGIEAVARANIVHYERGHLQEGVQTFVSLLWVLEQRQQQASLNLVESHRSAAIREMMATRTGLPAGLTQPVSVTLRALAESAIRMQPAHEYAAKALLWSRSMGFDSERASEAMRNGWSAVLEASRAQSAASRPLKWKALCEYMRLFFEGMEYSAEHSEALTTGTAATFVADNLRDPVFMIVHQCKQLEESSSPLCLAHKACQASLRAGLDPDASDPVYEGLSDQSMKGIRQQLVTMLKWLVQLRGLYHRLDGVIRFYAQNDPKPLCSHRFHGYHSAVGHVSSLLQSCCIGPRPRSTLLDLFEKTTTYMRHLDYFRYQDICGDEIRSLQLHKKIETQSGQLLVQLKDDLPNFIKWFVTATERSRLSVRFGVMLELMGFSLTAPAIADNMREMLEGTHFGRFCVFAVEMVELLHMMGTQSMTLEAVAEMFAGFAGVAGALPPGMDASDRRARRHPVVQKGARRIRQLVDSIQAKFPAAVLADLCERRRRHLEALDAIFEFMITSLRTAAPAAGALGTCDPNGNVELSMTSITRLGELMPDWTPQDMHDINLHAIALAELAREINVRVQDAFGGNFPALVWLSDCYEFDPSHAHKDMQLLSDNERSLYDSVQVIRALFKRGHFTPQPIQAAADTRVGLSDSNAASATSAQRETSASAAPKASGKKNKNKKKGKR